MSDNKNFKNVLAYWTVKDNKSTTKPKTQESQQPKKLQNTTANSKPSESLIHKPTVQTNNNNNNDNNNNNNNSNNSGYGIINNSMYGSFQSVSNSTGYELEQQRQQEQLLQQEEEDGFTFFNKSYSVSNAYSIASSEFEEIGYTPSQPTNDSYSMGSESYVSSLSEKDSGSHLPPSSSISSFYSVVGSIKDSASGYSQSISSYSNISDNANSYELSNSNVDGSSSNSYVLDSAASISSVKSTKQAQKELLKETRSKKSSGRDWNNEFQQLLRLQPGLDKFQKLSYLALDFVKAAENYGFIIIKEMFMPVEMKTIKPIDIGGIAGGQKFRCQNILFKFAYDQEVADGHYLYGGKYPYDLGASKAAGNELKGLSCFFQHALDNELANVLNVPLMCIIDYYGYRLIAMSVLPISKKTLIYGSSDGGNLVHKDIDEVNDYMKVMGESMNLKGHLSGVNPQFVYGPGDLEIHKSSDARYYCIDFGRLFPPEAHFDKVDKTKAIPHREVFYKLLRPELLKQISKSLSSDAFTGWSHKDPDCEVLNKEVGDATIDLYNKIIPEAASQFEAEFKRLSEHQDYKKSWDISVECHKFGINLRHMGRVRQLVQHPELRMVILNEMVARIFKNKIKEIQRINLTGHFVGSEEKCIQTIVDFINRVFNVDRYESEKDFWTVIIKTMCMDKYGVDSNGLSEKEMDSKYDLLKAVNLPIIMAKFQVKTGIKLDSRIKKMLATENRVRLPMILPSDIKEVRPVIKHSNMIARSEGISLYMKATELIYRNQVYFGKPIVKPDYNRFKDEFSEEVSLLELCNQKLRLASRSSTTDGSLYHLLGLVEMERYKLTRALPQNNPLIQSAREMFKTSIKYNPTSSNLLSLASIMDLIGQHKEAMEIYTEKILKLFPLDVTIPLLYESASFYSTIYTSISNVNNLSVGIHQCFVLIDALKSLPSDQPLKLEFLNNIYYIMTVHMIKILSSGDFQYINRMITVYTTKYGTNHTVQDAELIVSLYIEAALSYNGRILDAFLDYSFKVDKSFLHAVQIITCCKFSPTLTKLIKEYLNHNHGVLGRRDIFTSLLTRSNHTLQSIINHLNIPLESFVLFKTDIDISTQPSVKYLYMKTCSLNDGAIYQNRVFGPRIQFLSMDSVTIKYSDITSHLITGWKFPNLKRLKIISVTCPMEFVEGLFQSCKNSLESMSLAHLILQDKPKDEVEGELSTDYTAVNDQGVEVYYPDPNEQQIDYTPRDYNEQEEEQQDEKVEDNLIDPEEKKFLKIFTEMDIRVQIAISEMVSLQKITLGNFRVIPKYLPSSLVTLKVNDDCYHEYFKHVVEKCKNIRNIKTSLKFNFTYVKVLPLESLNIHGYTNYLEESKFVEGIENTWSHSMVNLKMFHQNEFKDMSKFLLQLKNLTTLDISYKYLDDQMLAQLLGGLKNLINLAVFNGPIKLLPSDTVSTSIQHLTLGHISSPIENYSNVGLIFPNIVTLSLDYPRNFEDVAFMNLFDHLNSKIHTLNFRNCFDITDTSLIYLSQSKFTDNLERASFFDSIKIGDGAYVKLIDSCPKLNYIRPAGVFKRTLTLAYLRSKYPALEISFRG
ncbi:hypothetical protein DLAC_07979 [Tieghemostelium lacteum]|uniref:Clu domain-containing protein n=1 Tax=Tieghemostelium lacteum TaxID=361077 RepID=A0A151ZAW7_TIELA|nr:hypothetical protein DLAC_07979 [Tieghemostelium lacteum]|eukprot:KYQ91076.1 hypothetical protein DLAC_07979 [Tieghemostelium lacteum]